ncbi:MAG: 3-hydroxybutyryl-CoA dehydrogenase, partial [Candidatus Aminicenantes bacterium]|nr:3-hydroxybutyryl-CoA dehydrogenase [Candidatus Aminicenantes bacterium]
MDIKKIGVIGAGAMGTGIAQVAATSGFEVILNDVGEDFLQRSMKIMDKSLSKLKEKGKIEEER